MWTRRQQFMCFMTNYIERIVISLTDSYNDGIGDHSPNENSTWDFSISRNSHSIQYLENRYNNSQFFKFWWVFNESRKNSIYCCVRYRDGSAHIEWIKNQLLYCWAFCGTESRTASWKHWIEPDSLLLIPEQVLLKGYFFCFHCPDGWKSPLKL